VPAPCLAKRGRSGTFLAAFHRMRKTSLLAIALLGALAPAAVDAEPRQQIVPPGRLDSVVRIRDVRVTDGEISGTIVNLTSDELRDLRLRARDVFLWRNEMRPGTDDPSRAEEFTIAGPIPPGGAVPFTAPHGPLPQRRDGDFSTTVELTSVTQQPVAAQAPPPVGTTVVTP